MTLPRLATLALTGALAACSGSDPADPPSGSAGTNAGGTGGTSGTGTSGSETGGTSAAGSSAAGTSAGGTFSQGGSAGGGAGGTFGTAGTAEGGGGAGGAGAGGGGAGGTAGTPAGGGGMGGTGGTPPTEAQVCEGAGWTATAAVSTDPPSNAVDRDADRNQSRFTTGRPMMVGDWLQVDFGRTLTVDDVSIRWGANDYAGKYDVRLSDTPLAHTAMATVAGVTGAVGTQKVDLPYQAEGRYLLITLTQISSTNWWSIQDVFITCGDGMMGGGGAGGGGAGGAGGGGAGSGGAGGGGAGGGGAGGTATGGTGGTATGGTETGGTSTGGTETGGSSTGGTGTGGTGGTGTTPECVVAADCANDNFCLDVACVEGQCVKTPNSAECPDDNNPCTDDVCSQGSCGEDTGVCVGSDLVTIRAHRPPGTLFVYVDAVDGSLKSNAQPALAAIFQQEFLSNTKVQFKLKDMETGLYVGMDPANDRLLANADAAAAMVFGAPDCTPPFVGLYAYGDDDVARAVTAPDSFFLEAARDICDPNNAGAWEKFELLPVVPGCKADADCDDGNPCTAETCNAGQCAFTDQPSTVSCADDGNACTSDVCMGGLCVHENKVSGTECGATLVNIKANRNGNYIVVTPEGSYLDWDAPLIENATLFEMVDVQGTTFKLRADNGKFVRVSGLGANPDELVANASYLEAGLFDNAACGAKQSFRALNDVDDMARYVKTDSPHLRAINGSCGDVAGSWEQFEFIPVPVAMP